MANHEKDKKDNEKDKKDNEDFDTVLSRRMTFMGDVPSDAEIIPVKSLGAGCELLIDKKYELTIERAAKFLELPEFIIQGSTVDRNLRDRHVEYLIIQAKSNLFHPEWVTHITAICDEEIRACNDKLHPPGTEIRMNGQHTSWMRMWMPPDWPCFINGKKYRCKTVHDMRQLYGSIDRNAVRTDFNVFNAIVAGTDLFRDASKSILSNIKTGFSCWLDKEMNSETVGYLVLTEHKEITQKVVNYLVSCTKTKTLHLTILRTPVVAALYETFSKLPSKAHEFWNDVRDGTNCKTAQDPKKKLHDNLKEATIVRGRTNYSGGRVQAGDGIKRLVSGEEIYRWCIHAWNAWRREETISALRANLNAKRPRAR